MLLTETNIIHYLMGKGLAEPASFVKGNFSCRSSEGRHRHFCINKEFEGPKLFIKQAPLNNAEKTNSMLREGHFYKVAAAQPFQELQPYLPAALLVDKKNAAIVFEYYSGFISLYDWLLDTGSSVTTRKVATELGTALFSLHAVRPGQLNSPGYQQFFSAADPWILGLAKWNGVTGFAVSSGAEQAGVELIFSIPGFKELITETALLWEQSATIHGDCKLNNFLLHPGKDIRSIKWIDWEIVAAGDPLWDMATLFQSALTAWVFGQDPFHNNSATGKRAETVRMQQLISLTWEKYAGMNQWDTETGKIKLEKCTRFTALRLLHACFETTPGAKNLPPYSARLLQLAHNILSDPASAQADLLGISSS